MGIDIRLPIGMLFSILGIILTIFGAIGDKSRYSQSLGVNVNLWWGIVLIVFGVIMLMLSRRGSGVAKS
jgi:putative Mn2+ efflux pump MntP